MFNNIIYFIIVLLIFAINHPDKVQKGSFLSFLTLFFLTWGIFAAYCRWGFLGIQKRLSNREVSYSRLSAQYHQLIARLSILSIFLFILAVYLLNLKYWIRMIPGMELLSVLQGMFALAIFFIYLGTIWYFAYPVYRIIFQQEITRRSFLRSNLRLNLPILFPWMALSLVYDLIAMSPWGGNDGFLSGVAGNIIFFAGFITLLMIYMPVIIQYWWGCKPLEISEKTRALRAFLRDKGFRYRHLLRWPIFEGQMMTAGIMGLVSRYRYILVTDALLEVLTIEELKAVLAHEMGHAKYRHLFFYVLFFVGFMVISFGLQDVLQYIFYMHPFFMKMISGNDPQSINIYYLVLTIPMLVIMVIYFRYVMGFFMRNFERQADLYSSVIMGSPGATVSSLEKVAYFSGKTRDLPSWHHFSIRERIDFLMKTRENPGLIRRHNRFVTRSFFIYLACIVGIGYTLNFSPMKQYMAYSLAGKVLNERLLEEPDNIALYQDFAMVCHEMGKYRKAIETYDKIINLDPNQAVSLNNLAWILVTAPDQDLRDKVRALDLAKRAVAIERSAIFLDTLAEAYYANGRIREAVEAIDEAISVVQDGRDYYEKQLKRFLASEQ